MLKEGTEIVFLLHSLVKYSKFLMRRCSYTIQHVLRKDNKSADNRLAKIGADQDEALVVMEEPQMKLAAK
ncbi:hypothetical protein ACSBR2_009782 [Camellia fascicularis]